MLRRRDVTAGLLAAASISPLAGCMTSNVRSNGGHITTANVRGPIPITPNSAPYVDWVAADDPLAAEPARRGYVTEEYFISGDIDGGPYSTTLLIRKPADHALFSGLVVLETLHAGGRGMVWPSFWEAIIDNNHGYAMVVSQKPTLDTLVKPSQAARYSELGIPKPTVPYTGSGGFGQYILGSMGQVMAEQARQSVMPYAGSSYAILTQAGALLKTNKTLFGAPVRHLVMSGSSQSGSHTVGYMLEAHRSAVLSDRRYVFDGYMPQGSFWDTPFPPLGVPVALVLAEGEMAERGPQPYRRPDSDAPNDKFRLYEIAGASHVLSRGMSAAMLRSMFEGFSPQVAAILGVSRLPGSAKVSQFPFNMIKAAMFVAFADWVGKGLTPPRAEWIATDTAGNIQRDEHGNTIGGVRSSYLDVPFATFSGRNIGFQTQFESAKLRALYGDEAGYVARVQQSLDRLVAKRYLLRRDAAVLLAEARRFTFAAPASAD